MSVEDEEKSWIKGVTARTRLKINNAVRITEDLQRLLYCPVYR